MTVAGTSPDWLVPLPPSPPPLAQALEALHATYLSYDHSIPTHLCSRCFDPPMANRIIAAARLVKQGRSPQPEDFAQIHFEHAHCAGGEDTLKLFLPMGVEKLLYGPSPNGFGNSYPEVLETAQQAAFWFWPTPLQDCLRDLAIALFYDWFGKGQFTLSDWRHSQPAEPDLDGPADDILDLCLLTLISPADMVQSLSQMHTPWADNALAHPIANSLTAPFYCSPDSLAENTLYQDASAQIAETLTAVFRQAQLAYVTPDWLQNAFFRNISSHPELAAQLSDYENYYDVKTVKLRGSPKGEILLDWPDLAQV